MNVRQMREKFDSNYQKMVAMDKELGEDGVWTDEQRAQFDEWGTENDLLDGQIKRQERLQKKAPPVTSESQIPQILDDVQKQRSEGLVPTLEERQIESKMKLRAYLQDGTDLMTGRPLKEFEITSEMTSDNTAAAQKRMVDMANAGNEVAKKFLERAQLTSDDAKGGYTVPDAEMAPIVSAMKRYNGVVEAGATVIPSANGRDWPIPTSNDTSKKGRIVSENASLGSVADIPFGSVTLSAYKFSSDPILLPTEFVEDTMLSVDTFVDEKLGERIGRIQAEMYTSGTGTNQPTGVITDVLAAGAGSRVTLASATATITYPNLLAVEGLLEPSYLDGAGFMISPATFTELRGISGINNQPIWFPAQAPGLPNSFNGRPYWLNDEMPARAANAVMLLFGNFRNVWVRQIREVTIYRLPELYRISNDATAVVATARSDARLIDAGTRPVVAIRQGS